MKDTTEIFQLTVKYISRRSAQPKSEQELTNEAQQYGPDHASLKYSGLAFGSWQPYHHLLPRTSRNLQPCHPKDTRRARAVR